MNEKPRHDGPILFFHTDFMELRGGEKYVFEIIRHIHATVRVTLFVERINPYWKSKFDALGVPTHSLWKPPCLYWLLIPLTVCINFFILRRRTKKNSIIFATNFPLNFLATLLSKRTIVFCFEPLSIFYDRVRVQTLSFRARMILGISKFFFAPLDHYAIWHGAVLATLNQDVAQYIKKIYHRTPEVYFPNGVNSGLFIPRRLSVKRRPPTIVHSTDFTILKGTELLIRALPLIKRYIPTIRLLISEGISNTKVKSYYRSLVNNLHLKKQVVFVGRVPEAELPLFYARGNVFCFCGSPYCGGGSTASLSVIEAQSCGIPVVRSMGGKGEIKSGKTGLYICVYTPGGIADTLLRFFRMPPAKKRQFSKRARAHVIKHYSWSTTRNSFLRTVRNMSYETY